MVNSKLKILFISFVILISISIIPIIIYVTIADYKDSLKNNHNATCMITNYHIKNNSDDSTTLYLTILQIRINDKNITENTELYFYTYRETIAWVESFPRECFYYEHGDYKNKIFLYSPSFPTLNITLFSILEGILLLVIVVTIIGIYRDKYHRNLICLVNEETNSLIS